MIHIVKDLFKMFNGVKKKGIHWIINIRAHKSNNFEHTKFEKKFSKNI